MATPEHALDALPDNRAATALQRKVHEGMGNSPALARQRAASTQVHGSPRMAAQRQLLGGLAPDASLAAARPRNDPGGLPAQLRSGIEALSGMDMGGVRVHRNSSRPTQLQALAYAQGNDIHLAPGQERHLPHEAWHVVQQRQGRVQATVQAKGGVGINDDPALEQEADRMGERALQVRAAPGRPAVQARAATPQSSAIQCNYGALNDMGKARVDQQADEDYARKALEFELGMAQRIMDDAVVNSVVDGLIVKIRDIVDAWATHTGRAKGVTYEREFGWPPGDGYYGAFETTAQNVNAVLRDRRKPMRMKLKLVYNAVRNNSLTKWLKVAATELDRQAKGKTARDWKIKSDSHQVVTGPTGRRVRKTTTEDTVTSGFATTARLHGLAPEKVTEISDIANRERRTEGWFSSTKRDVFDQENFGEVLGWHDSTKKANRERRGNASRGVALGEQNTLTVADIPDLTDEEVDLALKRNGNPAPDGGARGTYRGTATNKLPWAQGGEYYDVELGSESSRAASEVKARMEAGISGSTDLMLHAATNLGINGEGVLKGLRLALAGWMMANRDHSFYEVFKAAAAYGVPFILDRNNPGAEYEAAENLSPMSRQDFAGILPNDGVLNNVFPRDYLSIAWKDALALALPNAANTQDQVKTGLRGHGISEISQDVMTPRDTAALQSLDAVVAAQGINGPDQPQVKAQAVRRIRQSPAFTYLGNTFGEKRALNLLNSLLLTHHAGKGVTKDSERLRLQNAGIPNVILDFVDAAEHTRLEAVRVAVQAAAVDPVLGLDMVPIDTALLPSTLSAARKEQVKAALIRKYHGNLHVPLTEQPKADVLNRIAQVEEIANMERTTATWYTWSSRASHLNNMNAASLREATSAVPSTQGPGLYIGRKVVTSSGYGAEAGKRVMVVKMSGVPTINRLNAAQMARLRLLGGGGGDPLQTAGLYHPTVRTEFLMIYGGGNFARLTTNKGVTLSLDLKIAPVADLRADFRSPGLWSGVSKTNFQQQAAESSLDVSTW
ncbi:MAG: DUF4157 domain-containing protein [Pseudomonadota bacterium]